MRHLVLFLKGAMATVLLTACATTHVESVWKDPSYQVQPGKILVIGVSKSPVNRRVFEDEFVRQIRSRGADAIASYAVLPDAQQDDQPAIAEKVRELNVDAVLITRLVSTKTVQVYVPGSAYFPPYYYNNWRDYYLYGHEVIYTPPYIAEDEIAVMESNLYDTSNDKLIWAALSETGMRGSDQILIRSYIGVVADAMHESGLLGK